MAGRPTRPAARSGCGDRPARVVRRLGAPAYRVPVDRWAAPARASERSEATGTMAVVPETYGEVWRCCAGLVDRVLADDLARSTLARALADGTVGAGGTDRVALLRLACTACADLVADERRWRRRRARRRRAGQPAAAGLRLVRERPVTVHDLLAPLPAPARAAFVLTQLVGVDYATAAVVCGTDTASVRRQVATARIELLDQLDRHQATLRARQRDDGAHGR